MKFLLIKGVLKQGFIFRIFGTPTHNPQDLCEKKSISLKPMQWLFLFQPELNQVSDRAVEKIIHICI